jgi:NAD(P)H dehydrogenase (quinone)
MPDHAATETMLRDSGVPFTSLRNGFYATTAVMLIGQALASGRLAVPEDGPVSWTAYADLAAAAVVLADGGFDGHTPALTAGATSSPRRSPNLPAGASARRRSRARAAARP